MTRQWLLAASVAALVLLVASPAAAVKPNSGGPFGLGVILVEPTGLTGKYWVDKTQAIDFHLGFDGISHSRGDLGLYGDYLFNFDVGVKNSYFNLPLYIGPGLGLIIDNHEGRYCTYFRCYDDDDNNLWLALRMPLGVSFLFKRFGGEAFIELTTTIFIVPDFFADIDPALGFRFYF